MNQFDMPFKTALKNFGYVHGTMTADSYVRSVDDAISKAFNELQKEATRRQNVKVDYAKGNFAETWHAETFNVSAAARNKPHIAAEALTNNKTGQDIRYGAEGDKFFSELKYHKTGSDTAKAISNPEYNGGGKIVPSDQLEEVVKNARQLSKENIGKREEMVNSYQHTAAHATDRLRYENVESRPLNEKESRDYLERLKNDDKAKPADFDLTTETAIEWSDIAREARTAALHAAAISAAITAAPYVTQAISEYIKSGRIDSDMLIEGGEAVVGSAGKAGLRASVAATIAGSLKAGYAGETLKGVSPETIGMSTAIAINAIGYSVQYAQGRLTQRDLAIRCMSDAVALKAGFIGSTLGQAFIPFPLLGGLIGNMVGSLIGAALFHGARNVTLGLCVESGWTCFGMVDQNHTVPEEILRRCGFDLIPIERVQTRTFSVSNFNVKSISVPEVSITHLRRGVVGMSSIGYV
ncbi:hypothetical protein [Marinobacter sp.]|uniref:hypothetical protein n=1 Tax=Marinobacter sp. TaxID=50741 RepID=UPI003B529F32